MNMFSLPLLMFVLTGCGPGGGGLGEVQTTADAPWSMDAAATFLWNPDAANDGNSGIGALFVAVDGIECQDLGQTAKPVRDQKRGLVFQLAYDTRKAEEVDPPAWNGLYMTGGSSAVGQVVERSLEVEGWKDGSIFSIDGESWVQVDQGSKDAFKGSFATPWWRGAFSAEVCGGGIAGAGGSDTGS